MIEIMEMPQDNALGLRIDGDVTEKDAASLITTIDKKLQQHDTLRIYVEYEELENFSLDQLFQDAEFKAKYADRFEKGAFVSDKGWFEQVVKISDYLTDMEIKTFDSSEKEEALAWLSA